MKKYSLLLTLAMMMSVSAVYAGSIDYLSNQSANYDMNTSRNAATDAADIVAYNPAGTALMGEGFFIDVSSQTVFKYFSQTVENTTGVSREFTQDTPTWVIPNAYGVYNFRQAGMGNLAAYFQMGVVAGGGSLEWDGIAATFAIVPTAEADVKGSAMYFAAGGGVAYSLFDEKFSFSLGGKIVQGQRSQELYATSGALSIQHDYEYNAIGYTGVIGLDFKPVKQLTLGLTYQSATKLDFKYENETLEQPFVVLLSVEGKKMRRDLPQIIQLGAEYAVKPELSVSVSGNIYLLSQADLGQIGGPAAPDSKDVNEYYGTGYEIGFGAIYKITDALRAGGSFLYTNQSAKDELYTDQDALTYLSVNPVLDSMMFGIGCKYTILTDLDITLAADWVHYLDESATVERGANDLKVEYSKEVYSLSIGVAYKI